MVRTISVGTVVMITQGKYIGKKGVISFISDHSPFVGICVPIKVSTSPMKGAKKVFIKTIKRNFNFFVPTRKNFDFSKVRVFKRVSSSHHLRVSVSGNLDDLF